MRKNKTPSVAENPRALGSENLDPQNSQILLWIYSATYSYSLVSLDLQTGGNELIRGKYILLWIYSVTYSYSLMNLDLQTGGNELGVPSSAGNNIS